MMIWLTCYDDLATKCTCMLLYQVSYPIYEEKVTHYNDLGSPYNDLANAL